MRRAKVDQNHADVRAYFEAHGCRVASLARVGDGCPDLLVGAGDRDLLDGRIALVEVKSDTGELRETQQRFHQRFPVWIVRTDQDADAVIAWLKREDR